MMRLSSAALPLLAREGHIRNCRTVRLPLAFAAALRLMGTVALLLLCLFGSAVVLAQTTVSGAIDAHTHWTAANSPYVVTGDLSVQGGAVLTIDAGVTIYMSANTGLLVQSGGLKLKGTTADPVRVLSNKTRLGQAAAPGDWNQWIFSAGTTGTQLDHVVFEHGKGLVVNGSSPVFNYLDIRNQQGVAIAIDLAASPTGVGNQASGNNLNAISVPAGDIVGSVRWGLRGIPYVVTAGTLSVGSSPAITSVTPTSVEQGQTVTLTVSGARLTGVSSASFDQSGLALTPFGTGSSSQAFLQLKVDAAAPVGQAALRLQVDAGELVFPNAVTVTQPLPAITGTDPTMVLAGTGTSVIVVTGRNFKSSSEVLFNSASVATQFVSSTELRATLPNQTATGSLQTQVRSPDPMRPGEYLLSNQVALSVQAPTPPSIGVEPAPIALPPDAKPREVTIRLSKADYRDNTLNFSISDTSKATVSPASVVIAAGQTTAKVTIVPKVAGTVSLVIDSPTLTRVSVPLFITADFRGANTSFAPPVGVVVQATPGKVTKQVSLSDSVLGVSVGGVLTSVNPSAWAVGSTGALTITGFAIPANAQVSVVPNTGISLGAVAVSGDGTQLQVPVTTTSAAPVGMRRIVVKDGAGKDIIFANPARSAVQLMTGLPTIDSIEPVVAARGTLLTLVIRGRNLQQGAVRVLPDTGMRVDVSPQISADGTTLTTMIDIAADAPTGERIVQVVTPAGASSSTVLAANRLTVVSAVRNAVTPIASRLVGVVVGAAATPTTATVQPGSSLVGLLVGAGITEVTPTVGVIGTDVVVTVRGAGLQTVSGVSFNPSAGVSIIGSPTANGPGTDLTFTLRVDAGAAIGLRRLVLTAGGKPLATSRPTDGAFLISAPIPELTAVEPQILRTGKPADKFTVRGRNLANVSDVRIEPATGITVSGPFEVNADGTVLTFNAAAASGTASGVRTVIVTTAAGQSTSVQGGGNIIRIATQVGPTYSNVMSPAVGVNVGSVTKPPRSFDGTMTTSVVGVLVGAASSPPQSISATLVSRSVGLIVGSAAQTMAPTGWLQGASGTINVTGRGLDAVNAVTVVPDTGLLLGTPTVSDGGTVLTVPVSVAPDAPLVLRELRLATTSGKLSFVNPETSRFGIGSMPTMSSVSPIVFEQGKGAVLTIRGTKLKGVSSIAFGPVGGISTTSDIVWSTDGLGELLTVSVYVEASAPLGNRVVRLVVPGGSTTATPSPANTINVVTPQ